MQLHDFAGEIFVQPALAVLPGAGIRAERLLVVEKEQHRRMLLDRLQHVAETPEHVGPDRLALERARPHPRQPALVGGNAEMVGPERHQPLGEAAIRDHGALQPRQRLGAIGFLNDVERLRRRLCALGCIGFGAPRADTTAFAPHRRLPRPAFAAGSFPAMSMAMLLSERLRRCAPWHPSPAARARPRRQAPPISRRHRAPAGSRTDRRTPPVPSAGVDSSPGTSSSTPLGRLSSALTKPRGSEAALTKSPEAPPRAPNPKRLSATRAACESRAIGFPSDFRLLLFSAYASLADHNAVRHEPELKPGHDCGPIHDKSVRKRRVLAPPRLFRLRNGIHLQPVGAVLVRRGNRPAADAGAMAAIACAGIVCGRRRPGSP